MNQRELELLITKGFTGFRIMYHTSGYKGYIGWLLDTNGNHNPRLWAAKSPDIDEVYDALIKHALELPDDAIHPYKPGTVPLPINLGSDRQRKSRAERMRRIERPEDLENLTDDEYDRLVAKFNERKAQQLKEKGE